MSRKLISDKIEFKELLSLATKESCLILWPYENLYKHVDAVAMGSSLGLTLANAFLVYFENNWLTKFSIWL